MAYQLVHLKQAAVVELSRSLLPPDPQLLSCGCGRVPGCGQGPSLLVGPVTIVCFVAQPGDDILAHAVDVFHLAYPVFLRYSDHLH